MNKDLDFIQSTIQAAINDNSVKISENDNSDTVEKWDSLVTVSIATALSSDYNIELDVDELEKVNSVMGILELIEKHGDTYQNK